MRAIARVIAAAALGAAMSSQAGALAVVDICSFKIMAGETAACALDLALDLSGLAGIDEAPDGASEPAAAVSPEQVAWAAQAGREEADAVPGVSAPPVLDIATDTRLAVRIAGAAEAPGEFGPRAIAPELVLTAMTLLGCAAIRRRRLPLVGAARYRYREL